MVLLGLGAEHAAEDSRAVFGNVGGSGDLGDTHIEFLGNLAMGAAMNRELFDDLQTVVNVVNFCRTQDIDQEKLQFLLVLGGTEHLNDPINF